MDDKTRHRKHFRFWCSQCLRWKWIVKSRFVRARKDGKRLFCGKVCSGLARRSHIPIATKKRLKREYDIEYRAKNLGLIKAKKAAYYAEHHDREKERQYRQKRMPKHVEYCRRPEYRAWKHSYDLEYRAKKMFGQFAEAALILRDIDLEVDKRMTWVERHQVNGTLNKSTQRKRDYERITGQKLIRSRNAA